jgi:hypothetical protein
MLHATPLFSLCQIRQQLETLLGEKARLAHENTVYARENRFLREIVEFHQLNMQDVVNLDDHIEEEEDEEYIDDDDEEEEEHDEENVDAADPEFDQYDDLHASSPSHFPLPDVVDTAPLSPTQQAEEEQMMSTNSGCAIATETPRTLNTNSDGTIATESPRTLNTNSGGAIATESPRTLNTNSDGTIAGESPRMPSTNSCGTIATDSPRPLSTNSCSGVEDEMHQTFEDDGKPSSPKTSDD